MQTGPKLVRHSCVGPAGEDWRAGSPQPCPLVRDVALSDTTIVARNAYAKALMPVMACPMASE